jgi:hypothetical protein
MLKSVRTFASPETAGDTRPVLDRALEGPAFSMDPLACAAGAQTLRKLRKQPEQMPFAGPLGPELLFRLSLAAVCHQINWDFLSERLRQAFRAEHVDARTLSTLTATDVDRWLAGYHRPERVKSKRRAALLRDVGTLILTDFQGKAELLLEGLASRLYGPDGLLHRMDRFQAFREDPLRKKTNVFVHEIVRDGIAKFEDSTRIAPAIDYHIMRLYLRSGRVFPLHNETLELLKRDCSPRPRLVKLLREAVSEALSLTSMYAGMSIPEVNALEWQIGREVCDRGNPHCTDGNSSLADRLGMTDGRCLFSGFCRAFADEDWRNLREPDLKKSFY